MNIKRHRLGKLKRQRANPMLIRMILQAQTIASLQALLKKANQRVEVQRLVIEKLERQIHEEPRW